MRILTTKTTKNNEFWVKKWKVKNMLSPQNVNFFNRKNNNLAMVDSTQCFMIDDAMDKKIVSLNEYEK